MPIEIPRYNKHHVFAEKEAAAQRRLKVAQGIKPLKPGERRWLAESILGVIWTKRGYVKR